MVSDARETPDTTADASGRSDHEAAVAAVQDRLSLHRHMGSTKHGIQMMLELMDVPGPEYVTPGMLRGARTLRTHTAATLALAKLFVATDEVCRILNVSAPHYRDPNLHLSDVQSPFGMVWFAEPIEDPAPYDEGVATVPIRMMSWSITEPGESVLNRLGRYHDKPVLLIIGYADIEMVPRKQGLGRGKGPSVYPIVSVIWEVDSENGGILYAPEDREIAETLRAPYVKLLMAYWAICRQRLAEAVEPETRILPELVTKAKKRTPALNAAIRIVRMRPRRRTSPSGQTRDVDWQNQWVVGPHWRDQPYPSTGEIKQILIWPYRKGPEGKPLIGAERAFLTPKPKN